MFIEKPKNALQATQLPWERLLRRRKNLSVQSSDF